MNGTRPNEDELEGPDWSMSMERFGRGQEADTLEHW
jgi:hypothetical protein